ncbi:MAG TPA: hypothetical protein VNS32_18735 [Flavisolibacter sp.]|nr:hypothetical protein [Flavisolibacter sp.]HWJ92921.1 hypothetical protein [Flavisolibacter sp.]
MNVIELRGELSVKLVELQQAIDIGMPYPNLKAINLEIKRLQYELMVAEQTQLEERDKAFDRHFV